MPMVLRALLKKRCMTGTGSDKAGRVGQGVGRGGSDGEVGQGGSNKGLDEGSDKGVG